MTDTPPDRLSLNRRSPYFDVDMLRRGVGIRFKGKERTDVEEYCVSEGWIRVAAGKSLDRFGQPMTIKLSGEVEPYFQDSAAEGGEENGGEEAAPDESQS
jgi:hypothetical protein